MSDEPGTSDIEKWTYASGNIAGVLTINRKKNKARWQLGKGLGRSVGHTTAQWADEQIAASMAKELGVLSLNYPWYNTFKRIH